MFANIQQNVFVDNPRTEIFFNKTRVEEELLDLICHQLYEISKIELIESINIVIKPYINYNLRVTSSSNFLKNERVTGWFLAGVLAFLLVISLFYLYFYSLGLKLNNWVLNEYDKKLKHEFQYDKQNNIQTITINRKRLEKRGPDKTSLKEFLILENKDGFTLLKKSGRETDYKQKYIRAEDELLKFLLEDIYIPCDKKDYLNRVPQTTRLYKKKDSHKIISEQLFFLDLGRIKESIQESFFFSAFFKPNNLNQLEKINPENYRLEIHGYPGIYLSFEKIYAFLKPIIRQKIEDKQIEDAQSFLEVFIENCPQVGEIQGFIEHKFDLQTEKVL